MGSGCSFSRLASTGCHLKPLPFEGFCFLLFEDFSFLLLDGFSFGRLADVSLKGGCLIPFVATTMRSERPVACPTAQRSTNDNIQSHVRAWPRAS